MRFILCLWLLSASSLMFAQQLQLPKTWKFSTGDSSAWKEKTYDDAHWQSISIGQSWQSNGIDHRGFAWYRIEIPIVKTLKPSVEAADYALLNLGWINDSDSTFFNGKFIGSRGGMPPHYVRGGSFRQYEIDASEIVWDGPNVIAVKVYSDDPKSSGIMEAPFWIGLPQKKSWYSPIPADCPFERSTDIRDIVLTGKFAKYTWGDTWYPAWAEDGNLYSGYTDGSVAGISSLSNNGAVAVTGQAVVYGDNPMQLEIHSLGIDSASALPYQGRYPSAHLAYDSTIYIGTYGIDDSNNDVEDSLIFDIVGPFLGFRYSRDYGKTWVKCPRTGYDPLFAEKNTETSVVKFGTPHMVDFGKNMEYSPDGYAYMVAHGSSLPDAAPQFPNNGWAYGDEIYLCRVKPSPETINQSEAYWFYAGKDESGTAVWSNQIQEAKPLLSWNNHMGCVTVSYHPELKKYIMSITDGQDGMSTMDTYFLEADELTGEWRIITYWANFGPQAYFVNLPSKFIGEAGKAWLCYSANWWAKPLLYIPEPYGSQYGMTLQEIEFVPY